MTIVASRRVKTHTTFAPAKPFHFTPPTFPKQEISCGVHFDPPIGWGAVGAKNRKQEESHFVAEFSGNLVHTLNP
jgi:hypothetical protein